MNWLERYIIKRATWRAVVATERTLKKPKRTRRQERPGAYWRHKVKVFAELNEAGDRIDVHFRYDPGAVAAIKRISGARFVPKDKGGPLWRLPLDLVTGQRLREEFGGGLTLGDGLKAWGRTEVQKQRNLRSLARADDATLAKLTDDHIIARAIAGLPLSELDLSADHPLMRKRPARPYQRADIAMMATTNVLNANQPGTGKTLETIGAWVETGLDKQGPHLVIAPVRSLINVWFDEIDRWLPWIDIYTAEEPADRKREAALALDAISKGENCVVCINPDMLRLKKMTPQQLDTAAVEVAKRDHKGNAYTWRDDISRGLLTTEWATVTIDEFHMMGLPNRNSLFSHSVSLLRAQRKYALSGTPMGGKPRKLWSVLNWLEPGEYTSEWRWIDQWLVVSDNGFGKDVGDIQKGREDAFYETHARHLVRRLKREALPGLPDQVHVIVKSKMTSAQEKQYKTFAAEAEIRIDEERLSATSILAEYTRLKQFANAKQELRDGVPYPTEDSGKMQDLMEKLDEEGIRKQDPEPRARAVVASESSRMVYMVAEFLKKHGINCDTLTGDTKDSASIIKKFKSADKAPYIIVMTIQTGGVSLNLEEAGSMHALDEMWNPDHMEQFFDRGDRGSRTEPLRCYTYRSADTIQEEIARVAEAKKITNKNILDLRRQMFKNRED